MTLKKCLWSLFLLLVFAGIPAEAKDMIFNVQLKVSDSGVPLTGFHKIDTYLNSASGTEIWHETQKNILFLGSFPT